MNWETREADLQKTRDVLLPLLQQLMQNRCVNTGEKDSGNETKNANLLTAFFKEAGIETQLFHVVPNRDSLIAEIKGSAANPKVYGLMGHLDVVPADASKWSQDPFAANFDGEWLVGRGAVDMLDQDAIMATALREVISEKGQPTQTVKFMTFADEEADGVLGACQMVQQLPELFHCDSILTELGGYFIDPSHISIACSEKGILRIQLIAPGTSAHGSMPYKADNAALKICQAVARVEAHKIKPNYTEEALRMIHAMDFAGDIKEKLLDESRLEAGLEELYQISPSQAKLVHSALFLTLSLGILKGGTKVNVIPDSAEAQYDVRIQPGQTRESVLALFHSLVDDLGIEVHEREYCAPNSSSINTELYKTIEEKVAEYYPEAKLVPVVPAGVTDGRFFRPLGCQVYGFSLFSKKYTYDFFAKGLHGIDEKIDLESLAIAYSFYKNLLSDLLYR